jgi:hypothetical protein
MFVQTTLRWLEQLKDLAIILENELYEWRVQKESEEDLKIATL